MRNLGCALELPRGSQNYTRNTESTVDGLGALIWGEPVISPILWPPKHFTATCSLDPGNGMQGQPSHLQFYSCQSLHEVPSVAIVDIEEQIIVILAQSNGSQLNKICKDKTKQSG